LCSLSGAGHCEDSAKSVGWFAGWATKEETGKNPKIFIWENLLFALSSTINYFMKKSVKAK